MGQNWAPHVQRLQLPWDTAPTRGLGAPQSTQPAPGQSPQLPDAHLQNSLALVLAGAAKEREGAAGGSCACPGAVTLLPSPWARSGTQPRRLSSHPGGGGCPDPSTPSGRQQGRHVAGLAAELQPSIPAQLPALPLIDFAVRSRQAAAQRPPLHLLTLTPPGRGDGEGGREGGGRALQGGLRSPTAWERCGQPYGSCGAHVVPLLRSLLVPTARGSAAQPQHSPLLLQAQRDVLVVAEVVGAGVVEGAVGQPHGVTPHRVWEKGAAVSPQLPALCPLPPPRAPTARPHAHPPSPLGCVTRSRPRDW